MQLNNSNLNSERRRASMNIGARPIIEDSPMQERNKKMITRAKTTNFKTVLSTSPPIQSKLDQGNTPKIK